MSHTGQPPMASTENRILGCLYGQAIGDAMGMPSELWTKNKVVDYFGWIDDFLPGPEENIAANEFSAGEFTDDTSQCVALMDAVIEANGKLEPLLIAKHIMIWQKELMPLKKTSLARHQKRRLLR